MYKVSRDIRSVCFAAIVPLLLAFLLMPAGAFAQRKLQHLDRARYADVGYTKLGFGEVNQELLTERQAGKLNRRIERIRKDYGAVAVFVSLVAPEEVADWKNGGARGLPGHYLGRDPRASRNHVMVLFSEAEGENWIEFGKDNQPVFAGHEQALRQLFASNYRNRQAWRSIRKTLKAIRRVYARLPAERRKALRHPQLSAAEWINLAEAEMEITGDYAQAATHLQNAIQLDSSQAEAYMLLGYAYLELQNWKEAATALDKSWLLDASFETALGELTLYYQQKHNPKLEKWTRQVRSFSNEFKEMVYAAAHYESGGFFRLNTTRNAFKELFRTDIERSRLEESAEAHVKESLEAEAEEPF